MAYEIIIKPSAEKAFASTKKHSKLKLLKPLKTWQLIPDHRVLKN
jgi:hypothetical protein